LTFCVEAVRQLTWNRSVRCVIVQ